MVKLFANIGDPDQNAASDVGLQCLHDFLLRVFRLKWVKHQHFTLVYAVQMFPYLEADFYINGILP